LTSAVALIVALAGVGALIASGRLEARTAGAIRTAQTTSLRSVLLSKGGEDAPRHLTPEQIQQAKDLYTKLEAGAKKQIQRVKARYTKVLHEVTTCEKTAGNPACLLEMQAAMSRYETFMETESQIISGWASLAQQMLRNIH
jgi:hypothetical protein